jgi:glycosyltransferase involved in cell wall biosynthesis
MMQSLMPLISIVMPMFRAGDTLPAALKSLIRQDESRWEAIIVDDGSSEKSPDNSVDVAHEFADRDSRIRLLSQANAGACAARNTGLAVAQGRFVLFLDADDWLEPGALSAMSQACREKQLDAVHGQFRYARPNGTLTQWAGAYNGDIPLFEALSSSNVLSVPSCIMIRKAMLDDIGGFDTSLAHCGDWDLWARVARLDCRIGQIDQCVTGYRMRMASLSRNPMTLLRDATTVLNRIHARDARVRHPRRQIEFGAHPAYLQARLAGFTFYAAASATFQGRPNDAAAIMDSLKHWPALLPDRVAEFLIHAACFSQCITPDDLRPVPQHVRDGMDNLVAALEKRTRKGWLTEDVEHAMQKLGFGRDLEIARVADRERLQRPQAAEETLASAYLRSLALQECAA